MSRPCRIAKFSLHLIAHGLAVMVLSFQAMASNEQALSCKLLSTPDYFIYYSSQLVYASDDFALLHNFLGRVSTHIELATGKMIRSTFIGQPFEADVQILQGECFEAREVIESWLESSK